MALRVFGTFLVFFLLQVQLVGAQVRQVTGRVTSSQSGEGLPEATVAVVGTRIVAQTGADGRYVLNAPDGELSLVIRGIGFKRAQVTLPPEQGTFDVTLEPDVFRLEEVVVTGQSTGIEKQNLPNAVATVSGSELTRAPTGTLESALQGKIPGALIQANSGAPGGGIQVNLRGVSTINAQVDPLFVVDGIVISNEAIPNGADAVTAAQAGGNPRNQDNAVNRIADLNPADIYSLMFEGGAPLDRRAALRATGDSAPRPDDPAASHAPGRGVLDSADPDGRDPAAQLIGNEAVSPTEHRRTSDRGPAVPFSPLVEPVPRSHNGLWPPAPSRRLRPLPGGWAYHACAAWLS